MFELNDADIPSHIYKGDLLIAQPFLEDDNFMRTVVMVCEHEAESATFGLILNHITDYKVNEATQFSTITNPLYVGGPVAQNTLHYLHTFADIKGSVPINKQLYWGGNFEEILKLSELGLVNAQNSRFFLGYSGWGKNQLKSELNERSWIVSHANPMMMFAIEADLLWREVLRKMGGKYKIFSNYPINPRHN